MNKKLFVILAVLVVISSLLSACGDVDRQNVSDGILSVTMGTSEIEGTVTDFIRDSCNEKPDGTCKLMGE